MLGAYHYPKFSAGVAKEPPGRLTSLDDNDVVKTCIRSEGSTRAESVSVSAEMSHPQHPLPFLFVSPDTFLMETA